MEDMAAYRCHSRRSSLSSLCFTPPPEAELTDINSTVSQTGSMIVSNVEYDQEPPTPAGFSFANDDGEVQHLDIAAVPERHYNHSAPSSGDNATQNCSSSAKNTFVPKLDLPPINLPSAQTACLSSYIGYSDSDEDEDELNLALVGTDQSAPSQQTSTTLQQSDEFPSSHTSSELQNPPGTSSTGSHRSKKVERSESISRSVLVVSRSTSAMDRKRPHSPATPVPVKRTKTPGPFAESDDDVDTPDPPSKLSLFARIRKGIQKNIKDKQAQMKAEATATVISKDTHAQVQEKASGQERRLQTPLAGFGSSERARPLGRTAANSAVVGKQVVSSKRGQAAPPQTEAAQTFVSKRSTFQDGQPPVPKPNNTGTFGHEIKKAGRSGSASTVTKSAAGSSSVAKNTVDQSAKAIIPSIFSADRVGVDKRLMKASRNGRLELEEQSMKTKAAALAAQDTVNRPTNAKPTTGNRNSHRPGDSKKVAVVSELSGPQTVVPKAANKPAVPTASKTRKTSQHGDPRRAERPVQMASTLPQTSQQSSNQKTEASMPPTRTKKAEPQAAEAKKATVVSIPKSQPVTQKPASKPAGTVLLPADRKVAIQVQKVTRPALPTKVNAVEDNRTGVTQKADAGIASKNNAVVTPKSNTSITLNANTVVAPKADAVVASTIAPQTTSRIPEPDHVRLASVELSPRTLSTDLEVNLALPSSISRTPIQAVKHSSLAQSFEYTVFRSAFLPSQSPLETRVELSTLTNIDAANALAKDLQNSEDQQQPLIHDVLLSWRIQSDEFNCRTYLGTLAPIECPARTSYLKIWVERHAASVHTKRLPDPRTYSVATHVFALRLCKIVDTSFYSEDTKSESEDAMDVDDDDEDSHSSLSRWRFLAYHPLPDAFAELYTTLDAANRAARKLQIDMSHEKDLDEKDPKGRVAKAWQDRNQRELLEKVETLEKDAKDGEGDGCWESQFNEAGKGGDTFQILVEMTRLSGPRNL